MPDPTGPPPAGQTKHTIIGVIVRHGNLEKTYNPWRDRPARPVKKYTIHEAIVRPENPEKTHTIHRRLVGLLLVALSTTHAEAPCGGKNKISPAFEFSFEKEVTCEAAPAYLLLLSMR